MAEKETQSEEIIASETVEKLAKGFVKIYDAPLAKVAANLNELTGKQTTLIDAVAVQNHKLQAVQNNEVIIAMFADVTRCREELVQIKKQMMMAHDKSTRLRVRAQNVAAFAKNKQAARMMELENEQKLIAGHQ